MSQNPGFERKENCYYYGKKIVISRKINLRSQFSQRKFYCFIFWGNLRILLEACVLRFYVKLVLPRGMRVAYLASTSKYTTNYYSVEYLVAIRIEPLI